MVGKREKTARSIRDLNFVSEEMHLFREHSLSFADVAGFQHLYAAHGTAAHDADSRLRERLKEVEYDIVSRSLGKRSSSILLVGDLEKKETIELALQEVSFQPLRIPERFRKSFEEGLDLVEMELWTLRDELALLNSKLNKRKREWRTTISWWGHVSRIQARLLRETEKFGAQGSVRIVEGYLPEEKSDTLTKRLEREVPGHYYAELREVQDEEIARVPTRLKNCSFFKPFEIFVKNYGLPAYNDIDPTPLTAISFLLMFGVMFGDVGHGAVLALIGAVLASARLGLGRLVRSLGRIFLAAGCSAVFFGFLFGSLFGIESDRVLPALWIRPMEPEHLQDFLALAAALGICVISAGIILKIVQSFRKGRLVKAFFGDWSISSLAFYWILLSLFLLAPSVEVSPFIIGTLFLPLLLIVGVQVFDHFQRRKQGDDSSELSTILFEPVEVVMNLFTNTISFLRVAAFGLAHGGLMMAAFAVSDMIDLPGADLLSLPLEHLFIILFEGMIVTIQCLRLEYYEFFSKFFAGGGLPYDPLEVDSSRGLN